MYTAWDPTCRSCKEYVDTQEHQTSVHSPPDVKENHFATKLIKEPVTTDLQLWLDHETHLDNIIDGTVNIRTKICIQCAKAISNRFQAHDKQNENERKLLEAIKVPPIDKIETETEQEKKEEEEEKELKSAQVNWIRACRLLRELKILYNCLRT